MAPSMVEKISIGLISILVLLKNSIPVSAEVHLIQGATPPTIKSFNLENHFYLLNEGPANQISIECWAEAKPEPEIQWYKDGAFINEIDGIKIQDLKRLEIADPKISLHQGYYHCEASNELGRAKSEVINISPNPPIIDDYQTVPKFDLQPKIEIREFGKDHQFLCNATGIPRPRIEWSFNGEIIEDFNDKEILDIHNIELSKVGTYACNVSNLVGYDYKMVYLNILLQKPYLIEKPKELQTVSIHQDAIIRCGVKGFPQPKIQWFFQGDEIKNNTQSYIVSTQNGLTIKKIPQTAEGNYTCKATNDEGEIEAIGEIKVVNSTKIIKGPEAGERQVKTNVTMACEVLWDHSYELSITWKKNNVELAIDGERIRQEIKNDHHYLTITDLTFGDKGTYTCVAMTETGTDTDSGTLEVVGIPPEVITGPHDRTVLAGDEIILLCEVKAFPLPNFIWYQSSFKNDKIPENQHRVDLQDNRFHLNTETGTLTIQNPKPSDSAKYICSASNSAGKAPPTSAFVDIRERTKQFGPEYLTVEFKKDQGVIFDCNVEVDSGFKPSDIIVEWTVTKMDASGNELKENINCDSVNLDNCEYCVDEISNHCEKMLNNSLHIINPTQGDLGMYECQVKTPVDEKIFRVNFHGKSETTMLHIMIIVIICILIILITILCIVCVRKRSRRKGRYGVKDVQEGKSRNRSDIQYSIDDDTESLHKDDPETATNRTPIIKPKYQNQVSNSSELLKGSENSLLNMTDEDMWLRKGMDEDGSFRQVYIKE